MLKFLKDKQAFTVNKYKLNETRKIVSTLFPQDNDIITMIVDNLEYSYK